MTTITNVTKFFLAVVFLISVNAIAQDLSAHTEITDDQLITFLKDESTLWGMSNKRVVLGYHNGNTVVADHPCSDSCPMYTVRVVHYDLPLDKCKENGGLIAEITIPVSITRGSKAYCVPPAIKSLVYLDKIAKRTKRDAVVTYIESGTRNITKEELIKFYRIKNKGGK